ncbi:MAG: hypothetical protein KJ906_04445, partial [Nanoarchaeota archaeon]|nr:hypothetical protein [Nanoarchaeota archaeon]
LKQTQTKYLTKGHFETRDYMNKMQAYSERLGEIQEQLSTLEAKNAMKSKLFKKFKKKRAKRKK